MKAKKRYAKNKKNVYANNAIKEVEKALISVSSVENNSEGSDIDNINSLNFSERKDRFLIAITVIAALLAILKISFQLLLVVFDQIYVNKRTVFGDINGSLSAEHFMFLFFMTTALLILFKFLKYCYYEAKNFVNKNTNLEMENKTDKCYEEVFSTLFRCLLITSVCTWICAMIFSESGLLFIVVCLVSIFVLLVISFIRFKVIKKSWNGYIVPFFKDFLIYILIGLFLFTFILFSIFNIVCKGDFLFVNENIHITFEGKNEPENVNIKVINSNGESEKILNIQTDFMQSFVELTSYDTDYSHKGSSNTEEKTTMGNNQYYYVSNIDLSPYYAVGNNVIIISYEVDNKKFNLRNDVFIDENYTYAKDHLIIN